MTDTGEFIEERRRPQRRKDDPGGMLAGLNNLVMQYKGVLVLAGAIAATALWLGWSNTSPAKRLVELDSKIDRNAQLTIQITDSMKHRIDSNVVKLDFVLEAVRAISIDVCLRRMTDTYAYESLHCAKLLPEHR